MTAAYWYGEERVSLSCTDDLDDGNQRNHSDDDGEHQPADTIRPVRVDVATVTECNRRVIDQREHEQKLHKITERVRNEDLVNI